MDKNWAKAYGGLLKYILKLYQIDRVTFIEEIGEGATQDLLRQWLSGSSFPPVKYHICEVVRKYITERAKFIKDKQASDESLRKLLAGDNFLTDTNPIISI